MFLKNKKNLAGVVSLLLLFVLMTPIVVSASLVNCNNAVDPEGDIVTRCDFDQFIVMINDIINWIISIAGVIFTISAIWGGFLYMTSGENPGNKEKAKSILLRTFLGFITILVAWLIVFTILNTLVPNQPGTNSIFQFIGGR